MRSVDQRKQDHLSFFSSNLLARLDGFGEDELDCAIRNSDRGLFFLDVCEFLEEEGKE